MGDAAWFDLLAEHNRVFREELARAGGREVKAQGDGFMLAFTSVRRALTFAVAAQQRLAEHSAADPDRAIRVRIGLHTGEAITDPSGDLFGRHVIKAARIANLAAGGQILVSATVREIATGHQGLEFSDGEIGRAEGARRTAHDPRGVRRRLTIERWRVGASQLGIATSSTLGR